MDIIINTLISFIGFIIGFVLGTALDIGFFKVYEKIDPEHKNNYKLVLMVLVQIFFILLTIQLISVRSVFKYNFILGLMTSQIFLLQYAVKRLANGFCDRRCELRNI
jgi:hypothetical protein